MSREFIPYGRQWITEEDIQKVIPVLRDNWVTQGPEVKNFEEAFAAYCGARFAVAVSSGTAGLHLASLASGFQYGNEIITSPITFVASANCVLYTGARPIFADIDADTICLNVQEVEKHISSKTRGFIPVHFAGHPCDMVALWNLAEKHNITVIEDACHALGAGYRQSGDLNRIGSCTHSHMAVFSFHPVKHITSGEGGMITTNDKNLYEKLLRLRTHGITRDLALMTKNEGPWYYEMQELGFNYRITDIQCALGLAQLQKVNDFIKRRKEIAQSYTEAFKTEDEIILPSQNSWADSSWHLYVIQLRTANRLEVYKRLFDRKIGVQVHYIPVHLQPYYAGRLGYVRGDFPRAEKYYSRAISIPLFPLMMDEDVTYVIDTVLETAGNLKN